MPSALTGVGLPVFSKLVDGKRPSPQTTLTTPAFCKRNPTSKKRHRTPPGFRSHTQEQEMAPRGDLILNVQRYMVADRGGLPFTCEINGLFSLKGSRPKPESGGFPWV